MKRRDFLIGLFWGSLLGSIETRLLLLFKKERSKSGFQYGEGKVSGGVLLPSTLVAKNEAVSPIPKLRIFDSGVIAVTVGDELVYGDWECSYTLDFKEFKRAPEWRGRPWILNYIRDARLLAIHRYGRANPARFLRVSVNGIYANDIIDLADIL